VLSFCAFDIELYSMRRLVELLENLFKLFGGDQVPRGPSTRRYQKQDAPQDDVESLQQCNRGVQVLQVASRNRGIDLDGKADLSCPRDSLQGPLVGAGHAAKCDLNVGCRAIQAESQVAPARRL